MAKLAFDHCSADYARYRPHYPAEVVTLVDQQAPPGTIADIGSGTGIFANAIAAAGREVIAVEPSLAMLGRINPTGHGSAMIRRICATAEGTSLATATVSAVTCAQSFHWFNPPVALAEFARVLRSGGLLLLVWNNRDPAHPFVDAFERLVARWNPAYRREYRMQDWTAKIDAAQQFMPVTTLDVRSSWELDHDAFVGFTRSVSYIRNVLARDDVHRFEEAVRRLLSEHFPGSRCRVPLQTSVWWCHRRDHSRC